MDSTTSTSRFFGLDINSPYTWPGHPPMPTPDNCPGAELDPGKPVAFQGNPKFYYKWMRMIPRTNSGWNRNLYFPPGSSSPIMIDQVPGATGDPSVIDVCAWTLYIAQPDNQDCMISTYDVIDESKLQVFDTSEILQQAYLPKNPQVRFNCQDGSHLETDPSNVRLVEQWSMSQGSVIYASGSYYFGITNTGTSTQCIVSLSSFNNYDLKDVLESPVVTTHRPYVINWEPN